MYTLALPFPVGRLGRPGFGTNAFHAEFSRVSESLHWLFKEMKLFGE